MRTRLITFTKKRVEKAKNDCILERLILLNDKERFYVDVDMVSNGLDISQDDIKTFKKGFIYEDKYCYVFKNHPKHPVNVEQVSSVCRKMKGYNVKSLFLISASEVEKDARAMALRHSETCKIIEKEQIIDLLDKTDLVPNESEVYEFLLSEIKQNELTKKRLIDAFFDIDKGKAYALLAVVLAVWPLIGDFNIAYPIASTICGCLAGYAFLRSYKKKNND